MLLSMVNVCEVKMICVCGECECGADVVCVCGECE